MDKKELLKRIKNLENLELTATNVKMTDDTTVEDAINSVKQEVNGQRVRGIEIANSLLSKL